MATEQHSAIMEAYIVKTGHKDRAAPAILHDLLITMDELEAAEREISRLKRQISAGYIRRDISHHYLPGWAPKKPLPDVIADDWVATGRAA